MLLEQVGLHPNAAVALRVAWMEAGLPGLFRGTTSLLAREVCTGSDARNTLRDTVLYTCTVCTCKLRQRISQGNNKVMQAECVWHALAFLGYVSTMNCVRLQYFCF